MHAGTAGARSLNKLPSCPEGHPEQLAFSLMMIRLDGCLTCETDFYRAMRGCKACARQMLRRFKGTRRGIAAVVRRSARRCRGLHGGPADFGGDRAAALGRSGMNLHQVHQTKPGVSARLVLLTDLQGAVVNSTGSVKLGVILSAKGVASFSRR